MKTVGLLLVLLLLSSFSLPLLFSLSLSNTTTAAAAAAANAGIRAWCRLLLSSQVNVRTYVCTSLLLLYLLLLLQSGVVGALSFSKGACLPLSASLFLSRFVLVLTLKNIVSLLISLSLTVSLSPSHRPSLSLSPSLLVLLTTI